MIARCPDRDKQGDGWDAPVLGRIVEIVDRRAALLAAMTAPAQSAARRT